MGRDMSKILIVDNMASSFRNNKLNGVLIKPFYGNKVNKNDMALFHLGNILELIAKDEEICDIREGLKLYKNEIINKVTSNLGI